jgi:hypothetical protein
VGDCVLWVALLKIKILSQTFWLLFFFNGSSYALNLTKNGLGCSLRSHNLKATI